MVEKINKAILRLMLQEPFYYYIFSNIDIEYTNNQEMKYGCDTAGVRINNAQLKYELIINLDFIAKYDTNVVVSLLKHELCHIIYGHLDIYDKYIKTIFNIAADCEINQSISDLPPEGITLEKLGFTKDEAFKGSIYYYNKLIKNAKQSTLGELGKELHKTWNNEGLSTEEKDVLQNKYEQLVESAAENCSSNMGSVPRNIMERIDFIKNKRKTLDWKREFKKFSAKAISTEIKTTRYKLNRRFGEGIPYMKFKDVAFPLISVDTSGSMSNMDISLCFNEIDHIHKDSINFYVIECDADFDLEKDVYLYKGVYPKARGGVSGRGGTSMDPIVKYANNNLKKYSCLIHLTDGYIPTLKENPKLPTIIILTPDGASVEDTRKLFDNSNRYLKIIKMNK